MANDNDRSTTHLRIDFTVREVLGGEDQSSARYVTFGDDVNPAGIKDFFERCGISVDLLFQGVRKVKAVRFTSPCQRKIERMIDAIKVVRAFTGLGLKEAKDLVELPVGRPMIVCVDGNEADRLVAMFKAVGINEVEAYACNSDEKKAFGVYQHPKPEVF